MKSIRALIAKQWSSDARLDGKTAIVTGANSGIGKETAKDLAMRGAHVVLACRDMEKAEKAVADIMREVQDASVVAKKLDLADTKSICEFAENVYNTEKSLHFLINNAGVALCPYSTTSDGFELHFGVNHLGHFFLTFLLLDLLKHSAPSRVITLSSVSHPMGKINFEDVNSEKRYFPMAAYTQSKLANILFTQELARRVEDLGITAYAVDPGVVNTEIFRHMSWPLQLFMRKIIGSLLKSPSEGSYTTLFCTVTPDLQSGGYYRNFFCGQWSSTARLDEKTVIITGANTGIGKETARDLAKRGARIIMACRDLERGEAARKEIVEDSGNQNVVLKKLDLSNTKSVQEFAELINKEEKQLNILINNAGVMLCPYSKTADGFEMQIGVNHLGHFLLTFLLLDLIKRSSPARIVNVASVAHTWGGIQLDDINSEKGYNARRAYGQSKLANILCTRSLARRLQGTGVTVYSLHPGVVQTELWRHLSAPVQVAVRIFSPFTKTSVQGAQTTIYCAVEPALEKESGGYYSDCAPARCSRAARDDEMAEKLWELSCQMLGIHWD